MSTFLIDRLLERLHAGIEGNRDGHVADYIPELGKADPDRFGIALTTADGQVYSVGDAETPFTIQSISKPFMYGHALETHGVDAVRRTVGVEPTGDAFNSIVLDEINNRPFNPMVNAGAIAVSGMMPGASTADKVAAMTAWFSSFAGRELALDTAVHASETATGHRNRAIAHLMLNSGMISGDPAEILDLYFRQCALSVTARDLAMMAATLANDGVQPVTGARLMSAPATRDVLSVMATCGMYDFAGQWAFDVGMPAKSAVSGAIIAVVPGQLGVCAYAPPLDRFGNSIRGVELCRRLSAELGLHLLSNKPAGQDVIRRISDASSIRSKRRRAPADLERLELAGPAVRIVELQGALYFGALERLVRTLSSLPAEVRFVVLDFGRVTSVDTASERLFAQLCTEIATRVERLFLVQLGDGAPPRAARAGGALSARLEPLVENGQAHVVDDVDAALEWCEAALLATGDTPVDDVRYALARLDVFKGLTEADRRSLEPLVQGMTFKAGETILREGDPANMLFALVRGTVAVSLTTEDGRRKRLSSIGPGLCFGEVAMFDGGPRSADVIAEEPVVCYGLSADELMALGEERPQLLITIMRNLLADMSVRLRYANEEIRTLS